MRVQLRVHAVHTTHVLGIQTSIGIYRNVYLCTLQGGIALRIIAIRIRDLDFRIAIERVWRHTAAPFCPSPQIITHVVFLVGDARLGARHLLPRVLALRAQPFFPASLVLGGLKVAAQFRLLQAPFFRGFHF